jgi:hypothetical protein
MNKILKIVLIVVAVLVVAGGLVFAGTLLGPRLNQRGDPGPDARMGPGARQDMPGRETDPGREGGMRQDDGRGAMMPGAGQPGRGAGPGQGQGNNREQASPTPVTVDEATTAAQTFLDALGIDGLEIGDVTVLSAAAHVVIMESATSNGAFELVVDPRSRIAHPTRGAATMWNLKYGGVLHENMPGTPGGANATPDPAATPADVSADMPISAEQAVAAAQAFLDRAVPGATAAAEALQFYGYYSVSFSQDGNVVGVLSVNGYNGDVMPGIPHRDRAAR